MYKRRRGRSAWSNTLDDLCRYGLDTRILYHFVYGMCVYGSAQIDSSVLLLERGRINRGYDTQIRYFNSQRTSPRPSQVVAGTPFRLNFLWSKNKINLFGCLSDIPPVLFLFYLSLICGVRQESASVTPWDIPWDTNWMVQRRLDPARAPGL